MSISQFERNGVVIEIFKMENFLLIKKEIINSLRSKVLNEMASAIELNDNKKILNSVENITNENWIKLFGHTSNRILEKRFVQIIENIIFPVLKKNYQITKARFHSIREVDKIVNPNLKITDKSIYYRIVRSGHINDIGFAHRDFDFWQIDKQAKKLQNKGEQRLKFWLPVLGVDPETSLQFLMGSHKEEVPIEYVETKQGLRPRINENYLNYHQNNQVNVNLPCKPFYFLFHDKIVHYAGFKEKENCTHPLRISVEGTILIKSNSKVYQ